MEETSHTVRSGRKALTAVLLITLCFSLVTETARAAIIDQVGDPYDTGTFNSIFTGQWGNLIMATGTAQLASLIFFGQSDSTTHTKIRLRTLSPSSWLDCATRPFVPADHFNAPNWGNSTVGTLHEFFFHGTQCQVSNSYDYFLYTVDSGTGVSIQNNIYSSGYGSNGGPSYIATDVPSYTPVTQNISTSTTFLANHQYRISGDVEILSGVTLTIEPAVTIYFDTSTTSSMTVNGTLTTTATSSDGMIHFTPDTEFPTSGSWRDITVNSGGIANLSYVRAVYGGMNGFSEAIFHNNGGTLNISSSTIAYSDNYGVKSTSGTTTIQTTDIGFNEEGIRINGGSLTASSGNIIHDNSSYGIYNALTTTINAESNYWVATSGPYHTINNPTGEGDEVSDYVNFSNWISTALHYVKELGNDSVESGEIRWAGSTVHSSEWADAIYEWNGLGAINIATSTIPFTEDLEVGDENYSDVSWVGLWNFEPFNVDQLRINTYYSQFYSSNEIKAVFIHELGHALGLAHSYTGNAMYTFQPSQSFLGTQDISDYGFLWN